jgi:hypothetical protein
MFFSPYTVQGYHKTQVNIQEPVFSRIVDFTIELMEGKHYNDMAKGNCSIVSEL